MIEHLFYYPPVSRAAGSTVALGEPIWLNHQIVEITHLEQIAEHGGRPGLRDENALEPALARPRQLRAYEEDTTLPRLAAALCIGLARNHPFIGGNKLVALLTTPASALDEFVKAGRPVSGW